MNNIEISAAELLQIRSLPDFDLIMFLSEIHDHGWPIARKILPLIVDAVTSNQGQPSNKRVIQ